MKVKDVITKLQEFNPEVSISVIVHNRSYDFSICTEGASDGCNDYTKVNFYVDVLCESEKKKPEINGLHNDFPQTKNYIVKDG